MIDPLKKEAAARMAKSVDSLKQELTKLRTGRAHTSLLDHIMVSYYGNDTPLNQVASVTVADARTLLVTPWEKNMVGPIEKAILKSDLGLNPASAGTTIRVPLPPLTLSTTGSPSLVAGNVEASYSCSAARGDGAGVGCRGKPRGGHDAPQSTRGCAACACAGLHAWADHCHSPGAHLCAV